MSETKKPNKKANIRDTLQTNTGKKSKPDDSGPFLGYSLLDLTSYFGQYFKNYTTLFQPEPSVADVDSVLKIEGDLPDDALPEEFKSEPTPQIISRTEMAVSNPGLTPTADTIPDCYTVFLVKIYENGNYDINIIFTNVNQSIDNLQKLQKLIAVRVRALVQEYRLARRPLCLFGIIDCQLSKLKHEHMHRDLFNFARYSAKASTTSDRKNYENITKIVGLTTYPEYALLEFKIPDKNSKDQFTKLLTSIYTPDESEVRVTILESAPPGSRVIMPNINNLFPHSQPIDPDLLDSDRDFSERYAQMASDEVLNGILRNIRRNLFKVLDCNQYDKLVNPEHMYFKTNYTTTIPRGIVETLYCQYINPQGASCSTESFHIAGKSKNKRSKKNKKGCKRRTHKLRTKKRKTKKHASRKRMTKRSKIK
jgi:hypothetical protein